MTKFLTKEETKLVNGFTQVEDTNIPGNWMPCCTMRDDGSFCDSKFGRIWVEFDKKLKRRKCTIMEFYGGAVID